MLIRSPRRVAVIVSGFAAAVALNASPAAAQLPDPWPRGVDCKTVATGQVDFVRGANCRQSSYAGSDRRYVAWVSRKARRRVLKGKPAPVVVMLHGSSGTGEKFFDISGWRERADEEGLVAVFPTSAEYLIDENGKTKTRWSAYNLEDEVDESVTPPVDDVRFLRAMLADVASSIDVDPGRVFLSGFSNGGNMCMRAAMEMTRLIAAFGCNAGSVGAGGHTVSAGQPHSPVMFTFGSLDRNLLPAVQAEDPTVTEVPMDPAAAFSFEAVAGLAALQLEALGLETDADVLVQRPEVFDLLFDDPLAGIAATQMQFVLLDELGHKYPTPTNNPLGHDMAKIHWRFFENNHR